MGTENNPGRGRDVVEAALIQAAADVLVEQGPARTSVRDIAERAGVNKGQIHHYFGGKQGLVEAAVRHLAHEHYEQTRARSTDGWPVPLTLRMDNSPYLQAMVRIILDGDLDTASLEFEDGVSVHRELLTCLAKRSGLAEPDTQLKAELAAGMTMELGWAAFEEFILHAVDANPDEIEEISEALRNQMRQTFKPRSVR